MPDDEYPDFPDGEDDDDDPVTKQPTSPGVDNGNDRQPIVLGPPSEPTSPPGDEKTDVNGTS